MKLILPVYLFFLGSFNIWAQDFPMDRWLDKVESECIGLDSILQTIFQKHNNNISFQTSVLLYDKNIKTIKFTVKTLSFGSNLSDIKYVSAYLFSPDEIKAINNLILTYAFETMVFFNGQKAAPREGEIKAVWLIYAKKTGHPKNTGRVTYKYTCKYNEGKYTKPELMGPIIIEDSLSFPTKGKLF
jgi:hypothetical protein